MAIVKYSPVRVAVVTGGLAGAGLVFGSFAGSIVFALRVVVAVGIQGLSDPWVYGYGALVGGPLGALCAPIAGWLLLRDVPLGRAFTVATIGTIVGGAVGWLMQQSFQAAPIVGGAVGCIVAAILLRFFHKRRAATPVGGAA